jgi:glycosyltransferase involved in cell wall biosynthesis
MPSKLFRQLREHLNRVAPLRYLYVLFSLLVREGLGPTLAAIRRKLHVLRLAVVRPKDRHDLATILARHQHQQVFVYPPVINWHIPLFQRPQQMAQALARQGFLYFYCTDNCLYDDVQGFERLATNLYLNNRLSLLKRVPGRKILHLYSTDYQTMPAQVLREIGKGTLIVYEYVDELDDKIAGFRIPDYAHAKHRLILGDERCIVVATADLLYREVLACRSRNCALVTNGVDYAHFSVSRDPTAVPAPLRGAVAAGRPIIGYMGALASWFDYELVARIARERPGYTVVLIGFDYDGTLASHRLGELPNLIFTGPVPYRQLPEYACWFDVATIPFLLNDITAATSPVKLFEYMALGRPIVTTALPECRKYRSVLVAEDHDAFLAKLDQALDLREDAVYLAQLRQEALANTWDAKAEQIAELIRQYQVPTAGGARNQ